MQLHVHGHHPPDLGDRADRRTPVVGPQLGQVAVALQPFDAIAGGAAHWVLEAHAVERADGTMDLRGPWVHGRPGARFVYLSWGYLEGAAFTLVRRAKLMLDAVDDDLLRAAGRTGDPLIADLSLTGADGTPVTAAVRPPRVSWSVHPCAVGTPVPTDPPPTDPPPTTPPTPPTTT